MGLPSGRKRSADPDQHSPDRGPPTRPDPHPLRRRRIRGTPRLGSTVALEHAVVDASSVAGTPDEHAASYIFDAFIDRDLASTDINGAAGVSLIHDVAGLAQLLEIAPTLLTCEPIAFIDDHALVVPWSITERIARTAARHNSAAVRDHVRTVDAAYLRNTLHGAYLVSRGRDDTYVEADWFVRNRNAPQNAPYWELLRAWSGSHAEQTLNELDEYRRGVARASATAREAISLLRDKGLRRDADRLERQLAEMA